MTCLILEDSVCTPDSAMLDKNGIENPNNMCAYVVFVHIYISNKNACYIIVMNDYIRGPPPHNTLTRPNH